MQQRTSEEETNLERRGNWLGYVAVGLGTVALLVALGGRMGSSQVTVNVPSSAIGQAAPTAVAPSQAPTAASNRGQAQGDPRHAFGRGGGGRGPERHGRGPGLFGAWLPWGHHFGEGIKLLLGGLLAGLGLLLLWRNGFFGPRSGGFGRGRRWRGGHASGEWHGGQRPAPPAGPPPPPGGPSSTPPSPPYTGETGRFHDF